VTHPEQWEYLTVAEQEAGDLNPLGAEGWELVGVNSGRLYFKRPLPSFRERVTLDQKRHVYGQFGFPLEPMEGSKA
jgi:hypothetical protein